MMETILQRKKLNHNFSDWKIQKKKKKKAMNNGNSIEHKLIYHLGLSLVVVRNASL